MIGFFHQSLGVAYALPRVCSGTREANLNQVGSVAGRSAMSIPLFLAAIISLFGTAAFATGDPTWVEIADEPQRSDILIVEKIRGRQRSCEAQIFRMEPIPGSQAREFKVVEVVPVAMRECRR